MTDKEYIKGLLEEINICNQIISKYEELNNDYKYQIERLNNEYNKAFERLKSQQREIDRLKEGNERFENNMKSVLKIEKKQAVKEFAEKLKNKLFDFFQDNEDFDGKISTAILYIDIIGVEAKDGAIISLGLIDELLKEYEKWKSMIG